MAAKFKVGDEVTILDHAGMPRELTKIERAAPVGQRWITTGNRWWTKSGLEDGREDDPCRRRIVSTTEEHRRSIGIAP